MRCENCGQREATTKWVGSGGVMDLVHGSCSQWCDVCVLDAQLEHARNMAGQIPELEAKLSAALGRTQE